MSFFVLMYALSLALLEQLHNSQTCIKIENSGGTNALIFRNVG